MRCPYDVSSSTARLSISASQMTEVGASASPLAIPDESPSDGAPDYINETDGNYLVFFPVIFMRCSNKKTTTHQNYSTTLQGITLLELLVMNLLPAKT
jgi:hypothetical protein